MGNRMQETDFTTRLAEERSRLVRLCAWFSGGPQAAEDLAQETLLAAWKNQSQLSAPDKLKPWLSGIARNVCLNWSRKHYREQSRLAQPMHSAGDAQEVPLEETLADEARLELDLERADLARQLDQALALLPPQTAQMLVEHYIQESSHAAIAQKMGLKAGTVAVRLQRGKLSLQRLLRTHLQEEALAFGLLPQPSTAWEETNIWCPTCGQRRLLGQFHQGSADARFMLRCPNCQPDPAKIMVGHDLTQPYYSGLLGSTKTYKPAYTRLLTGLAPFYRQALSTLAAGAAATACLACGSPALIQVTHGKKTDPSPARARSTIMIHCSACDWETNFSLAGLVLAMPEAQRFWRKNPRMRTLPAQEIEFQGALAFLTCMQSLTGAAELVVITRRDSFALVSVQTNVTL